MVWLAGWPGLISGWTGLGFLVGFGFGSVGSLPFVGFGVGFSHKATSSRGMGVGHVLRPGCNGSSSQVGALLQGALFLEGWWGRTCMVWALCMASALGAHYCVLSSLLRTVLCCLACCGVMVVVLCVVALASVFCMAEWASLGSAVASGLSA
ncbi:hypothetical protein ATANTOWER_026482 [Ataeniobius toweri]|uniref:NADH dehydrogenase subunit 6 n=1 Tax=Ataeniobius toweri TaxID=208326 RepID=A0ABU7BXV4_9TELE|nr:hypothetical protein [Ataeniobius toweri]